MVAGNQQTSCRSRKQIEDKCNPHGSKAFRSMLCLGLDLDGMGYLKPKKFFPNPALLFSKGNAVDNTYSVSCSSRN
jgi:hypothetical protein